MCLIQNHNFKVVLYDVLLIGRRRGRSEKQGVTEYLILIIRMDVVTQESRHRAQEPSALHKPRLLG